MFERSRWPVLVLLLAGSALIGISPGRGQEAAPPPVPEGVEVQARGPVHEAYASLTTEAAPTQCIEKQPPANIEEMPPAEKPAGDVVWISGYWSFDDDRKDFLWVSGLWRSVPPGKQWVAGYWREEGTQWQWVPGFWTATAKTDEQQVSYLPDPPKPPNVTPPGPKPTEASFFVPGTWVWTGTTYGWRAGYWAKVVPDYVWINDHFNWTPSGYIYVPGYWDYALKNRGILYAPVIIRPSVITVGFVYTPAYAVRDTVVVDAMFVRPVTCHYYFGDYYEPRYRTMGFECSVVYSQSHYDSIIVYETYQRRSDPAWLSVQINLSIGRSAGTVPCPPRTLVQQTTVVNNVTNVTNVRNVTNVTNVNNVNNVTNVNNVKNVNNISMIAPASSVAAAQGRKLAPIDNATRMAAHQQAKAVQQVAMQRGATEKPLPPGAPRQARVASLSVPKAQAVKPGMVPPKPPPAKPASPLKPATPAKPASPLKPATPARNTATPAATTRAPTTPAPKTTNTANTSRTAAGKTPTKPAPGRASTTNRPAPKPPQNTTPPKPPGQ